jgi:hypothetical protein
MAKIFLKGVVTEVTGIETVGANNTQRQSVMLFVPGYTDQFGDKKGIDEHWQLKMLGERIGKLNVLPTAVGQKAECTVYISSRSYTKDDNTAYFIEAGLAEIKLLGASNMTMQGTATLPVQATPVGEGAKPDDDDLPF